MTPSIEERVQESEKKAQAMEIKLAGVDTQFNAVKDSLVRIEATLVKMDSDLTSKYVTKTEFDLVRNIVFGMVTLILVAVCGALIASVIINRPISSAISVNNSR